jgi:hypothetical protein
VRCGQDVPLVNDGSSALHRAAVVEQRYDRGVNAIRFTRNYRTLQLVRGSLAMAASHSAPHNSRKPPTSHRYPELEHDSAIEQG